MWNPVTRIYRPTMEKRGHQFNSVDKGNRFGSVDKREVVESTEPSQVTEKGDLDEGESSLKERSNRFDLLNKRERGESIDGETETEVTIFDTELELMVRAGSLTKGATVLERTRHKRQKSVQK